jgi:DNA-binding response OmpR family regulator
MTIAINPSEHQHRRAVVLVVEDNHALRETTVEILREEGHIVVQAADGLRALDLLRECDIDVLLLDLGLPSLDGLAVLQALEEPPTVVVVSGFESVEEDEIRGQFGSVLFECLRKPVAPRQLIAVTSAAARHATSITSSVDLP